MTVDYDAAPPFPAGAYRAMQANVPGGEALYASLTAICEASLPPNAAILVVGAGGGAEIEALGRSSWQFALTGVDPSAAMVEVARPYTQAVQPPGRAQLIKGTVADLAPAQVFDAATSIMVMHFLPDDGAKADYLAAIRSRLRVGAPFLHAEISIDAAGGIDRLVPAMRRFADNAGLPDFTSQFTNPTPPSSRFPTRVYRTVRSRELSPGSACVSGTLVRRLVRGGGVGLKSA